MKIRDFIIEQLINKEATIVAQTIAEEINKKLNRLKEDIFLTSDIEEIKNIRAQYDDLYKLLADISRKPLEVELDDVITRLNSQVLIAKISNALSQNQNHFAVNTLLEQLKAKGILAKETVEKLLEKNK